MLVKMKESEYLNSNKMIDLLVRERKGKYILVSSLDTGVMYLLNEFTLKEEAEKELQRIVGEINASKN